MVERRETRASYCALLLLTFLLLQGCKQSAPGPTPGPTPPTPATQSVRPPAPPPPAKKVAYVSFSTVGDEIRRVATFDAKPRPLPPLPKKRVEALIVALRDGLEFGPPKEVQGLWRLLREAYQLLLGDAESELQRAEELVIAADGTVRFVPFHALLRPGRGSPNKASFVVSRWVVSYLPPDAVIHHRLTPREATVLLPSYGLESAPVKSGPTEAQLARLGGRSPRVLRGPRATSGAMISALRKPRSLVHFAGHGLPNLESGGAPALIFGPEETLDAAALRAIEVQSSLVVLASCTTAYAARFRGKKSLRVKDPLPEALLKAGASSVIAASWGVKDAQSRAQMATFYRHLEARGPAEALALAQRERIARLKPPHPRYWAFYALYGWPRFGIPVVR